MDQKQKTQAIADCINKWSERLPFFESAHANLEECRVLWMNGGCIGDGGWAYTFAMYDTDATSAIAILSFRRHGIELTNAHLADIRQFCKELKAIAEQGEWHLDAYDGSECCFFN